MALLAPDATSPPGHSRVLVLRAAGAPLGVHEVADRTGLHPNTARFHLDGLVEAGLATRERQARATPGRPGMAYRAAGDGGPAGERRYRLLAEMLTTLITGMMPDPGKAAMEAGRELGCLPHRTVTPLPAAQRRAGHRSAHGDHGQAGVRPAGRRRRQAVPAVPAPVPVPRGGTAAPRRRLLAASGADAGRPGPDAGPAHRRPARSARRARPVHCSSDSPRRARPQAAARRYGLTAGRMRNWPCQTVLPDPARGRTALPEGAKVPSGAAPHYGTAGKRLGPTRGTPRRYPKEDPCANTAAAKPWPPSAN